MAERTDRRHDNVVHQGRHDFPEGRADDDTDGHIQHVAAHRKFFEFLEHCSSPCSLKVDCRTPNGAWRIQFRRNTNTEPASPPKSRSAPPTPRSDPTREKGTREIASITTPSKSMESQRGKVPARHQYFVLLESARAPPQQ